MAQVLKARGVLSGLFWNPLVSGELRARMRGWRAAAVLTGFLCVTGACGWLAYADEARTPGPVAGLGTLGQSVFQATSVAVMSVMAVVVPGTVGSALSSERERRTIDLLLVTRLGATRIIVGKLVSTLLFLLLLLMACAPLLAIAYLMGGVPFAEVVGVTGFCLAGTLSLGAVSMLASVVFRRPTTSIVAAYLAVLAVLVAPVAASYLLSRVTGQPTGEGPPPFTVAQVSGPAGAVASVSPAVGAASLLDNANCGVMMPFLDSGLLVPTVLPCGPVAAYDLGLGPLGSWPVWEATVVLDAALACASVGASVLVFRRRP